jgi:hypothetical protein
MSRFGEFGRVLAAGLFVFAGELAMVAVLGALHGGQGLRGRGLRR